uniref:GDT1 family protein n=1 Tax=Heterosigma akashiwo TaxID=2829 RepID=A0A6S9LQ96_HETAK|mmetsp:Transcript_24424/g.33819  ORF Transcript_24424/g.33819 Transcript_24424/m.33819 type:complete len:350 (-) Transcript_24424:48-1097(-)
MMNFSFGSVVLVLFIVFLSSSSAFQSSFRQINRNTVAGRPAAVIPTKFSSLAMSDSLPIQKAPKSSIPNESVRSAKITLEKPSSKFSAAVNTCMLVAGVALVVAAFPMASMAIDGSTAIATIGTTAQAWNEQLTSSGFFQAFSLVFVSEIGDKTFFIAGLLAMKTSKFISFVGSVGALAVMSVLSVLIGQVFHQVPPELTQGLPLDDYAAVAAFLYFGLKTLKDAAALPSGDNSGVEEELEEAEEEVEAFQKAAADRGAGAPLALIAQTFGLVFAAEFGDRSFLTTIALGAAQNPFAVAAGAIAAHASATGVAVLSGAYLTKYISEKAVGYVAGALFLVFAATTALGVF